jgi:hypothetical protein
VRASPRRSAVLAAALTVSLLGADVASSTGAAAGAPLVGTHLRVALSGTSLQHAFVAPGDTTSTVEPLTKPDDLTTDSDHLFVAFQNGVGAQGEPSASGNTESTVVEFAKTGHVIHQWDLRGKIDGLTADPAGGFLVATVNEDANSSLYTIGLTGGTVHHYTYSADPLPHNGGTDAISVFHGALLISASAPGTTGAGAPEPSYPAVYHVALNPSILAATVTPVFLDEDTATDVTAGPGDGTPQQFMLTDPDSSEIVPAVSPRFAGDFLLSSQGDSEQITTPDPLASTLASSPHLSVLNLTENGQPESVDDTAWATRHGTLFFSDSANDTVDALSGTFDPGTAYVAVTPCGLNGAPSACPAPGYPANFLGSLDLWSGAIAPVPLPVVAGAAPQPGGMLFLPAPRAGAGRTDQPPRPACEPDAGNPCDSGTT